MGKYPMTYDEYEKRVTTLFLEAYPQNQQEEMANRLDKLLKEDPYFIRGLYADTCYEYDHPEIYSETCKKAFEDYLLESVPVNTLNMLLGGIIK